MKKIKITQNPFLIFLPFLLIYLIIVLIFPTHGIFGDEIRYLTFAKNILHGFFSPYPNIDLGNGPGYPIILIPIVALNLPLIFITILNAAMYYLSSVFLFKTLNKIVSFKLTLIICIFWACYINLFEYLFLIYTEIFTVFLISLIILNLLKAYKYKNKNKFVIITGFLTGYLALTKPIFGYVIWLMLLSYFILWLFNRKSENYKKSILILLIAIITTLPYLIYTYSLSGKIFYWGSNGGNNLYWMSTPYKGEYGNWIEYPTITKRNRIPGSENIINQNHQKELEEIYLQKGVIVQDDLFKKYAINNIQKHPIKFIQNWISNVGRILFNFPYSYKLEKTGTLLRLPFNGILVVILLFCLIPTVINWKRINFSIRYLIFFSFLYLGGSTLGSAETRMFSMIVPALLVVIGYLLNKLLKIKLNFEEDN